MSADSTLPMATEDQRADVSDTASFMSAKDAAVEPTHPGRADIAATQDTESPEASLATTITDHKKADQSTAAMEPTQPVEAPAVGKHRKRNQNRKNKRKAARHGRFENLVEDATGDSFEVEAALPQADDTNDDAAPAEAAQDVVAKSEVKSQFSRALNLYELNVKLEKLAQAGSTTMDMQSVPSSFEMSEDDQFEDVREIGEDKNSVTDKEESSVTSKNEDSTADIDGETVTETNRQSRNARRNKKRSQKEKNKKVQNGIIALMNSLGMTEEQKLGAGFLAGLVVGGYLTRMLSYLGGN